MPARVYTGTPEDLVYQDMTSRRVMQRGNICWEGQPLFITTSLAGWSVGLKVNDQGQVEVWFGRLLLGWIEPATHSFQRTDIRPLEAGQP